MIVLKKNRLRSFAFAISFWLVWLIGNDIVQRIVLGHETGYRWFTNKYAVCRRTGCTWTQNRLGHVMMFVTFASVHATISFYIFVISFNAHVKRYLLFHCNLIFFFIIKWIQMITFDYSCFYIILIRKAYWFKSFLQTAPNSWPENGLSRLSNLAELVVWV